MKANNKVACFFTHEPFESIDKEQYSLQDINILKDLGYTVIIANTFKKIPLGCDLYFSWWASGSILPLIKAKISNKPIIVIAGGNEAMFYRDSVDDAPAGYLATQWYKQIATKITLRLATSICVVSKFMINDVKKLGAKKPVVLYNSIDTDKFMISKLTREYITIIFNQETNVTKLKRGEIFIKAIPEVLKKFPSQKILIIGKKGNSYEKLYLLSHKLGILNNITFVGSVKNTAIVGWLQKSIAYVQISDTETFGVAIAEAMSCGTHVVVSNRGAIPEVVGEDGVYVDHNDPKSTANGIIKVLQMEKSNYIKISNKLRNRIINHFSYSIRKNNVEKIIKCIF